MCIQNNDMVRTKFYIINDIESGITNLTDSSNRIHVLMSEISNAVGSSVSGADLRLIDACQQALQEIERALCELYSSKSLANRLNVENG